MSFTATDIEGRTPLRFSIQSVKYFVFWLMLWQGSMVGGSIWQLDGYIGIPYIGAVELCLAALLILTMMERVLSGDFSIRRSYFSGPLFLIAISLFVSWCHGCLITQRVTFVLEVHEAFELPIAFFIVSNAFRSLEDREALSRMLFFAGIAKSIDGVFLYFLSRDPRRFWGLIQLWRDGYLLGIGIIVLMLLPHLKGKSFRKLKSILMIASPVLAFTFVLSFRRTFIVGAAISAFVMYFTLPKEFRKKHVIIICSGFLAFLIMVFITNPVEVAMRLSGITAPQNEGSAYIRLMELPNVIENIKRNPIFGTAVGVPWIPYYRMPISSVYTTLGTHNTYLYWPLRTGIFGTIGFFWLLGRLWKSVLISNALAKTENDFFYGQLGVHMMLLYNVACFFGLMYGDLMATFMGGVLTIFQLQTRHVTGRYSLREVALFRTLRDKELRFKTGPNTQEEQPRVQLATS